MTNLLMGAMIPCHPYCDTDYHSRNTYRDKLKKTIKMEQHFILEIIVFQYENSNNEVKSYI
jgi:hypothetical protein